MSRPEIRAVLGLSVLVILLFSDAVFRGGVLYARDVYLVWYAYVEAVRRSLASGSYPFWNPFVAFGQPLWANPAVQVLYPSTWIALLVGPRIGYLLFVVVHLVFSGLGLFLFAQRLGISRVGSFVSAVLWVASGPFLSMATLWHHFAGVAFFPWILLATDTALRRSSPRSTPLGVAVAFQILAGSADACEMSGLLSLAYALHLAEWKPARLLRWAFGWTFGIALGAAQWLPTLAQATQSARWGLPDWIRTYWSLHPWTLSELALPFSISTLPIDARVRGLLFESREPLLLLYVGALSFGIALSSLARPRGAPLFFALAAVVATGVALGKFGPLYPLLTRLIPPLRILRYPVKAMAVTAFSISVLAGLGFETSSDPGLSRLRRCLGLVVPLALLVAASFLAIVFLSHHDWGPIVPIEAYGLNLSVQRIRFAGILLGLALLLALLTLQRPSLSRPLLVAISGLAILDVMALDRGLISTASPAILRYRPPIIQALQNEGFQRIHVSPFAFVGEGSERHLEVLPIRTDIAKDPATLAVAKALAIMDLLFPNVAGRFDIEASYDRDALGLYPHDLSLLVESMWSSYDTPAYVRFLQLGAVDKVVAAQYLHGLVPLADYPSLYPEPVHLLGVPNPLPRCYAASGSRIADGLDAVHVLTDPGFEPRAEVVLPSGQQVAPSPSFKGSCEIEDFRPDRVQLKASLSDSGYLVLVDAYDPGWRVSVDGNSTTLLRADTAFRAVALGAGVHQVQFIYRPRAIEAGILVSLVAFSLLALFWWRGSSQKPAESR